jgi:hypothetical protein
MHAMAEGVKVDSRGDLEGDARSPTTFARFTADGAAVQTNDLLAQVEADPGTPRPGVAARLVVFDSEELLEDA